MTGNWVMSQFPVILLNDLSFPSPDVSMQRSDDVSKVLATILVFLF